GNFVSDLLHSSTIFSSPLFFFNDTATTAIYTLSLHDALPISPQPLRSIARHVAVRRRMALDFRHDRRAHEFVSPRDDAVGRGLRSEEHTSELQSRGHLVCRLLLEKKKKHPNKYR